MAGMFNLDGQRLKLGEKQMLMTGLVPYGDFVIAWSGGPLHSENDFYSLIESHVDKPLRLFVYNSDLE